jgi:hypothetical protein
MKLKFELVNGYGILVDQEAEINNFDLVMDDDCTGPWNIQIQPETDLSKYSKVIFAEKELGLDVPVFEWRDFEVEKLAFKNAKTKIPNTKERDINDEILISGARIIGFKEGYKSNPAKYTENDLMILSNFIIEFYEYQMENKHFIDKYGFSVDKLGLSDAIYKLIQSLQKYPEYVVMENNTIKELIW